MGGGCVPNLLLNLLPIAPAVLLKIPCLALLPPVPLNEASICFCIATNCCKRLTVVFAFCSLFRDWDFILETALRTSSAILLPLSNALLIPAAILAIFPELSLAAFRKAPDSFDWRDIWFLIPFNASLIIYFVFLLAL